MLDVVIPNNDEQDFVDMALKLGYDSLCFLYSVDKIKKFQCDKIKIFTGVLADSRTIEKCRKLADFVFFKAEGDYRLVIEKFRPSVVFDLELVDLKANLHYRVSGLNHVLANIASEKNVIVAFNFGNVLSTQGWQRSEVISRMLQNILLCQKYKAKMLIASFAKFPWQMSSPHDLQSFFRVLGMKNCKECFKL